MLEPSREVVAAFDLDGTLTDGGSVFRWLGHVAGAARAYRAAAELVVPLTLGALRSGPAADGSKERLFARLLEGRDAEEVAAISRAFIVEHLEHHARPDVVARLRWHQHQGHPTVIVSASPELYVSVAAQRLGVDGAIGTRLATDPTGRLTGHYDGANCRGAEKARRLEGWLATRGGDPKLYAYGNSRGDRRMLERADYPFNVGRLGRLGRLRRYPRLPRA